MICMIDLLRKRKVCNKCDFPSKKTIGSYIYIWSIFYFYRNTRCVVSFTERCVLHLGFCGLCWIFWSFKVVYDRCEERRKEKRSKYLSLQLLFFFPLLSYFRPLPPLLTIRTQVFVLPPFPSTTTTTPSTPTQFQLFCLGPYCSYIIAWHVMLIQTRLWSKGPCLRLNRVNEFWFQFHTLFHF